MIPNKYHCINYGIYFDSKPRDINIDIFSYELDQT
jgi:hypothetical protein